MSDPEMPIGPTDDDTLAGELALGVLDGEDRATALRRLVAEPDFATAVERWQHRLAPMLDGVAEVSPPASVWPRIAAATIDAPDTRGTVTPNRWRTAALAAMAIAACLAILLLWRQPPPAPPTPGEELIAQLVDADGDPLVVARYDSANALLRVRTSNLPVGDLRPELWVIGADAKPRSLGLIAANATSNLVAAEGLRSLIAAGATFAVTMEPATGAPHAAPTGTILATAKLARL